ncbi:hypothetical protein [Luteolibacter sp. LG18]|uniref:hypothetical protein n=1 Tax=Luteolibacter sp. LG18 TaxID=2819286 RepID=UPI002B29E1AC|nr:hypothetical protein llg_04730 [Luteolibacter sp. LG18]
MLVRLLLPLAAFALLPASGATSLLINFSSASGNDMTIGQANTLGADALQNVRTGTTNAAGTTATISLDGVTGSATYADYFQASQLANLGQPYATFIGGAQIGSTGNEAAVSISGLNAWMTANNFTGYQVTLYYAGRSLASENLASTSQAVTFVTSSGTSYDTVSVLAHGTPSNTTFWSGTGAVQNFNSDTLSISVKYLSQQSGLAAIKITGVPEPSAALLGGLGALALLRRRRP